MIRSIHNNENSFSQVVYVISNLVHSFFRQKATLVLPIIIMFLGTSIDAVYASQPTAFTYAVQPVTFVERIVPEPIDIQSIRVEDELREQEGGPYRFAIPRRVVITPDANGMWEEIDDDTLLWRIHITSPGATSISFGFTRYLMPRGGSLFIYSADGTQILGPYTKHDNAAHRQLWTPLIHSDDVVVELTIPAAEVANLELTLGYINHGYRRMLSSLSMDKGLGDSDWCEIDVNCPAGNGWRDQIRSVAHYHVTLADGTYSCTGTLINNTAGNDKNYFLTAFHCFDEYDDGVLANPTGAAASMVVYWNFQASTCGGITGPENQTQTGAYFRAAYCLSDFVLVELDEMPLCSFGVYYAGWDRNSTAPSSGVAIHHPAGDLKKISVENHALTSSTGLSSSPCITSDLTHFKVSHWEVGTTEGGSSGCAFFNPSKRVVGQLSGGTANCDSGGYDKFGRVYRSWTGGGTSSTRLSNWLDPLSTGALTLDGKNPSGDCCYCSASGGCDEYISRVVVGTVNNATSCAGYADYTTISTIMQIGQSYAITVTNGNPYSSDQCGIWVDWNQDCDFGDAGETISVSGTPGYGPYTATITVPAGAVLGDTRMRIRITYTGSVNPCGSTTYGEVEDYTISVSLPPAISVTPASRDFGSVQVGSYSDLTFTVQNVGGGTLSGNASTSAPFSIVSGGTYNLSASQSQVVTVRFSPTAAQSYNGTVTFTGGGGATRPVSGTGLLQKYTITATFGENGTVEPNGVFDVNFGDDIIFTAQPNPGYTVDWWYLDGNSVQQGNMSYTLYNVQADHNVLVTFIEIPPMDLNNDGIVNFSDFAIFAFYWMDDTCSDPDWCEGSDSDYSGKVDFVDLLNFVDYWLWCWADLDLDGAVNFTDYAIFANHWMDDTCCDPNWCEGTDFDKSGSVDMLDLATFARYWLEGI